MSNIIIVEDEAIVAMENRIGLNNAGHQIVGIVSSAKEAIRIFEENSPDLILMDIKLKGETDGVDAMKEIRKQSDIPVIFLTGYSDNKTKQRISTITNSCYMPKPFLILEMIDEVNKMLSAD